MEITFCRDPFTKCRKEKGKGEEREEEWMMIENTE